MLPHGRQSTPSSTGLLHVAFMGHDLENRGVCEQHTLKEVLHTRLLCTRAFVVNLCLSWCCDVAAHAHPGSALATMAMRENR